jgi:tetratricopeptide (TPR) repeat protein
MYDNMMNKFRYGNVNKPGIYLDENTLRMCRTHRMMFSELAEALYEEGKHDKAIEVLDYAEEMLPGYNVSYDYTSASMAALYYTLGEMEKGSAIMNQVAANAVEYLEWGSSLEPASRKATQSTIGHYSAVLGFVLNNLQRFEQKELFNKYFELYNQYASVR